ncbi:MAG: TIGR03905 family TSCPD domain-containing protein [Oscillospiraceae bacterium]|nr:TIGR03905 family TSCPD domain-containing protein [Oscillospiraceae bacterium]MBQ3048354.1 TIGR03905 family TSCPD domain-containing protein [Oscillospiraceae bacterium]MBQ9938643.1 TIGR03905 family TSCPD domain-containing protein [Oscillospiraceae bacterium]
MRYQYMTSGVCSRAIELELENGIVKEVKFIGGCKGNTQGVAALIRGMDAKEAVERIKGIDCGGKGTSCPDQLSKAIELALEQE